jgi:hypothetical protein
MAGTSGGKVSAHAGLSEIPHDIGREDIILASAVIGRNTDLHGRARYWTSVLIHHLPVKVDFLVDAEEGFKLKAILRLVISERSINHGLPYPLFRSPTLPVFAIYNRRAPLFYEKTD